MTKPVVKDAKVFGRYSSVLVWKEGARHLSISIPDRQADLSKAMVEALIDHLKVVVETMKESDDDE